MSIVLSAAALLTGLIAGAAFGFLNVPIPAPPNLAGVLGIVGIFLGYRAVETLDVGIDLLALLGLR
ncbi:MAG: XapX domain-containing protein [Halapricum sp.]